MKSLNALLLGVLVHLAALPANADIIEPVVNFGIEAGGDTLATVYDGFGNEVGSISAGDGLRIGAGMALNIGEGGALSLVATINYKFSQEDITGGKLLFSTIPVDVMAFIRTSEKIRFGAGVTSHTNTKLECTGPQCGYTNEYEDGTGFIVELEYTASKIVTGFRLTSMEYADVGASSIGFFVTKPF